MDKRTSKTNYRYLVRHAREQFLDSGVLPDGVLPDSIHRSWERCVKTGLALDMVTDIEPTANHLLSELREKNGQLLMQSQAEMENLYAHIMGTQSMVILSDAGGTILHAMGDDDFMTKAQRVALQPGVTWREDITGTNAIGTAIVEKNPVLVKGAEHYAERNGFLNCSASPIIDPHGELIGVLDVSSDYRQPQEHTMALVRMSAQMIENRLFNVNFSQDIIVRFHTRLEFIGTLWEGIAVFSPEAKLIATNRIGAFQLGLGEHVQLGVSFDQLFGLSLELFLDTLRKRMPNGHTGLSLKNGLQLFAKADHVPAPMFFQRSEPTTKTETKYQGGVAPTPLYDLQPLDKLDHGDLTMRKTLYKAKLAIGHELPILIEGETGTGKELLARALHQSGTRKHGPFIAINCAAIPEGLIESELFGHEEGAFTGARRRGAIGRIQQAHGGTLFLDEIGEMPLALQASLLRVIQEREVMALGGGKPVRVDIAIISATNMRLKEQVAAHRFREDLYYRLNGLRLSLPPLRERQDFSQLVQHILTDSLGRPDVRVQPKALQLMQQHPWPGNIRQLTHALRSSLIFMETNEIQLHHLPEDFLEDLPNHGLPMAPAHLPHPHALSHDRSHDEAQRFRDLASTEAMLIQQALQLHQGNMVAAAEQLGISRATLYRKSKRMGLR